MNCKRSIQIVLLTLTAVLTLADWIASPAFAQLSTEDHLAEPGFWPRQQTSPGEAYAGSHACAKCHGSMVASQQLSRMAQAAMPASAAQLLISHSKMSFRSDQYSYDIRTDLAHGVYESRYSIRNDKGDRTSPLQWAFGAGRVAQSYLFTKGDGSFYEARVTYYQSLGTLAFTPARALSAPSSIEEAMYRPIATPEVLQCFSCHTTGSTVGGDFDSKHLVPGIQCEACHGPGLAHVNAMGRSASGQSSGEDSPIYNPGRLLPTEAIEFCGSCHGSWWDVKLSKTKGVSTTRSAPYRLATSKCWGDGGDTRLECTGCHDPHKPLETRAETYDAVCLQCHLAASKAAGPQPVVDRSVAAGTGRIRSACPVATRQCTSCHMPRTYVPEMRDSFTDHRIRVVRSGEAFPE